MVAIPPLDYNIQIPRPDLSSYAQRAQTMQNLQQSFGQFSQSIGQVLQAQIQAENQRKAQAQFQQDMATWRADPTTDNYVNMLIRNPWAKDQAEAAFKATEEGERKNILSYALPAYSALSAGDTVAAGDLLRRQRDALMNAGQVEKAKVLDELVKDVEMQPSIARGNLQMLVARGVGPEKALEFIQGIEKLPSETRKSEAEAGTKEAEKAIKEKELARWDERFAEQLNLDRATAFATRKNAQTQARRQGLDEEEFLFKVEQDFKRLTENTDYDKVPAPIKAQINERQAAASQLAASASQLFSLAQSYEDGQVEGFGKASQLTESIKKFLGAEDPTTLVRLQFDLRRKVAAMQQLRGTGPVSNFELQTFLQGWPEGTADISVVTAFLRGQAKAAQVSSALEEAEAVWMASNQGVLGPAAGDMVIGGIPVERGMAFGDFQRKYGAALLNSFFPEKNEDRNRARGYIK